MTCVHILIFGEMAGFKIVPYIASHVKKGSKVCDIKGMQYEKNIAYLHLVQTTWGQYQSI